MQSDLFHCKVTLHVSGVTAPSIVTKETDFYIKLYENHAKK
jgi:hypothetical protein